jgi:transposase
METRGDRTITEVAESLGIAGNLLHRWRKTYSDTTEAVRKERGETAEDELKRLRREVAQLKRDKKIVKKAAVFGLPDRFVMPPALQPTAAASHRV